MMNEQLDRMAARARAAVEDVAKTYADPDGDLAEVYAAAGPLELRRRHDRHPRRWIALAAAAVIVVIGAALVVRQGGDTDPRLVPATPSPQTTSVPTTPATSTPARPRRRSSGPVTSVVVEAPPAPPAPGPDDDGHPDDPDHHGPAGGVHVTTRPRRDVPGARLPRASATAPTACRWSTTPRPSCSPSSSRRPAR